MKKILSLISILLISLTLAHAQNFFSFENGYTQSTDHATPIRTLNDRGLDGIDINYQFAGAFINKATEAGVDYQHILVDGFGKTSELGKPSLPQFNDLILIPEGSQASVQIISSNSKKFNSFNVYPALEPAVDKKGAPEPDFYIDQAFYSTDAQYPFSPVRIEKTIEIKGLRFAVVQINPVQFNPAKGEITVHSDIKYTVSFSPASEFLDINEYSNHFLGMLPNYVLNFESLTKEIQQKLPLKNAKGVNGPSKNYIIITHSSYLQAAEMMANWKRQLGYSVEVVSQSSWTATQVKNAIQQRYANWTPKPDYFLIIGDHTEVPGDVITNYSNDQFATDLYFACMDGGNDYVPDMAKGRISVSSASEAHVVVNKIIKYESDPPSQASFYTNGLNAAYFQHAGNGYAQRRFAQTAENIRDYVDGTLGYNVSRVYVTGSSVSPRYWNNGSYSAGEPLPNYLKKPTFAWDGDNIDINNGINSGTFYVFHRDHGYENGWGDPAYSKTDINNLNNGDLLPVVFSINCLTGKFLETECFSERFLRRPDGGAVGVFCHAEVSMSGYNDGLSLGLIDAIWANPGLVANFTGSAHTTGTITPHSSIHQMGDVANQGLLRMTQTWGDGWGYEEYTHQLFHYFGDPAMRMWTQQPTAMTATYQDSIHCVDSTFVINTCSEGDALATLVANNELLGKVTLSNGSGIIQFSGISGNYAILTISKHNHIPIIDTIPVQGGCVKAAYDITYNSLCPNEDIVFTDNSTGTVQGYTWDFGAGASPATANSAGPHTVYYTTAGQKTITLTVVGAAGPSTITQSITIDPVCAFIQPSTGTQTITSCDGILYDMGGPSANYADNVDITTIIQPAGATSLNLNFSQFDIEAGSGGATACDYDYLSIYDGPNSTSTLIGTYCNTTGAPSGTITTTGGAVTLVFHSDGGVNNAGFTMDWACSYPNAAPQCDFNVSDTISCTGTIDFSDNSINVPNNWYWDFGDGNVSTMQNPTHTYTSNGYFTVKLVASNSFGADSVIKQNIIHIQMPAAPTTTSASRCNPGTVVLTATPNISGSTLDWYTDQTGGTYLGSGTSFTTPSISTTTTFYVEEAVPGNTTYGGKTDNSGGGGYFGNASYQHHLNFDVYTPIRLVSVKVYADGAGNRTIELRSSSGTVLDSKTVNIPDGESRVTLNFDLPVGNDLQLYGAGAPDLFRNNAGVSYPYTTAGLFSITSSSASSNPAGYYYYFYDWEVEEQSSCVSSRTPATATIMSSSASAGNDVSICTGESTVLNATGGGTYSWSNGSSSASVTVSPATTTTYTVTVDNAGCTATDDVVVSVLAAPNANAGNDQDMCAGSSASLNGSGGTIYAWSTGGTSSSITVSPQSTTTYTLTVSNSACSASDDVVVTVVPNPTASAGQDQDICAGGTANLNASGGTSYAWSNGGNAANIAVSPTQTTTYLVTVTDNGCTDSDEVIVSVHPLPSVNISPAPPYEICQGDSLELTASPSGTFLWSPGGETSPSIMVYSSGTFSVDVTDQWGCTGNSGNIQISSLGSGPTASFSMNLNDPSVNFNNTTSSYSSCSWDFGDGYNSTLDNPTHTYANNGTYIITMIAVNACGSDTVQDTVTILTIGMAEAGKEDFLVYPNPAQEIIYVEIPESQAIDCRIQLLDPTGRLILESFNTEKKSKVRIPVKELAEGVYFIRILNNKDQSFLYRIMKY